MILSKNILIVDDCAEIQMLLNSLLTSEGYQVSCASNGQEALDLLGAKQSAPDAILVDMRMPVMNGLVFLESIKQIKNLNQVPIVLMSGDDDLHEKGLQTQAKELLKKPLNVASVLQALHRLVAR